MNKTSELEIAFVNLWQMVHHGDLPFVREHVFHHDRKWRLDFAWPAVKVAVELDGGTARVGQSRHTQPKGFEDDCNKLNAAIMAGWCVLRFTAQQIRNESVQSAQLVAALIRRRDGHVHGTFIEGDRVIVTSPIGLVAGGVIAPGTECRIGRVWNTKQGHRYRLDRLDGTLLCQQTPEHFIRTTEEQHGDSLD